MRPLQEHNGPAGGPTAAGREKTSRVTLYLSGAHRRQLEARIGDHDSLAAFARWAIGRALDGATVCSPTMGRAPRGMNQPIKLGMSLTSAEWLSMRAEARGVSVSWFLYNLLIAFPETPRRKHEPRVRRSQRIVTKYGRRVLLYAAIRQLLIELLATVQTSYSLIESTQIAAVLMRLAEAIEENNRRSTQVYGNDDAEGPT